jgi:hypothetical protein
MINFLGSALVVGRLSMGIRVAQQRPLNYTWD